MNHNEISKVIIDKSIMIHRSLGPGLFESVYQKILSHELQKMGLEVIEEKPIPVLWDGVIVGEGFRADLIVNQKIIVELKSIETITSVHKKQLLTYLRLTDIQLGLLLNFGEKLMKDGIYRIVNGLEE